MGRLTALCAVLCLWAAHGCAAPFEKPRGLPDSYRDFKIYSTSKPDAEDPARVVLTVQMRNEGRRTLRTRVLLQPNAAAGFAGAEFEKALPADTQTEWPLELRPPAGLGYELLEGDIFFRGVRARRLYIAVRGPDPADFDRWDVERITARAEAVATYAPRARIDWWRTHPSSSIDPAQRVPPLIELAAEGRSGYAIVVGPMPEGADGGDITLDEWAARPDLHPGEQDLIWAVEDLRRCLGIMSGGAELPIVRTPAEGLRSIHLRIGQSEDWPHSDAYHLSTTRAGDVVIEAGHVDGLRQGTYGLLTDHLDCHWFMPRQLGEEIPRTGRAVVGQIDERIGPSFFSVTGVSWWNAPRWERRNRCYVNRGRMAFGHAWASYLPPSEQAYKEHPEWWARDREGKVRHRFAGYNKTNFCSTNPEVIGIVAEKVNRILSNPDALVASLDPQDGGPMCLCDRCLALDKSYGVTQEDGTWVTDRLLHFSEEIYDRLDEANKGKYLGILVYGYQTELPSRAVPHDHDAGLICQQTWRCDHTRPFNDPTSPPNRHFYELVQGWGKILPVFGFYDYYGSPYPKGPWGLVHKMREDLPAFHDLGESFLMIEAQPIFAVQGLNHYIAARLAWDIDADVDVLLEEFFTKYYGPAAEPMRSFWMTIERYHALTRPGRFAAGRVNEKEEMWHELDGYLKEAEALVAGAEQGFQDRVRFHREGLGYYRAWRDYEREFFPPGEPPDYAGAIGWLEERMPWVDEFKRKYAASDPYWPTHLPTYYYPDMAALIADLKEKQSAQQRDAAPQ